jgi:peptide/nickel transport system substrate-binding protein
MALSNDPGHLNPAITTMGVTHEASELLYNGLVAMDHDLTPIPELASAWSIEGDGAVYRFTLAEGVKWHDGTAFSSRDVKFTFEEVLLKYHGRARASLRPSLDGIETPDDRTVVFRFKQPYAPLLHQLDVTEAPILASHIYAGSDPEKNPANLGPIGTGPFKFSSFNQGVEVTLVRNAEYFKKPLPHLETVRMRVIPDSATRVLALQRGEVDWIHEREGFGADTAALRADRNVRLLTSPWTPGGANCVMTVSFNLDRPVFQDVRVRQAIYHALDRRRFLDEILFGQGAVATAPISSGIGWAHAGGLPVPSFDPRRAEMLLDAAGWKRAGGDTRVAQSVPGVGDGTAFTIDFVHFPAFARYGELVRQQLGAVGIEVTQKAIDPTAFAAPIFRERAFDTNLIRYCHGTDPEIGVRRMFHSAEIGPTAFTNAAGYRNPRVDSLLETASRTLDRRRRAELYGEFQKLVVSDLPYLWLVETMGAWGHTARCQGFRVHTGLFLESAFCR